MIDYIKGRITSLYPTEITLETYGIGYRILISLQTYQILQGRDEVTVYIHHYLREEDELIGVRLSGGEDEMLLSTRKGMSIRFNEKHVRNMGRNSMGVRSIRLEEGVWRASDISAPFLLGFPQPRIYLPWGLEGADLEHVLAHERTHIRRGDPWWRFLGWTLLCLHWFNPLCWLAYFLMGRDMELSCDEAVLAHREGKREEYARSLLHIAARVGPHSPAPLAFGEIGVKQRVANVMRWRRLRGWTRVLAGVLCGLFFLAAATDAQALALPPRTLTLNTDGTVGALRWGMTVEEARAACPELTFVEPDGGVRPWAV